MNPLKLSCSIILTQLVLLCCSVALSTSYIHASENTLRFVINSPGTTPFIYYNFDESRYQGVVVDFFDSFAEFDAFKVEYIDSSRARNERLVQLEKADLFLGSSIWVSELDKYIFSDVIMSHNSYVYATQPFTYPFNPKDFKRAHICTRHDFVYPILDPFFKRSELIRVDSSSQTTMTYMLSRGRCQFTIMSDDNARAVMSAAEFCNQEFYQSPLPFSEVNLSFVMGKKLTGARQKINNQLAVFIASGDRDRSIQKHVGPNVFPKPKCAEILTQR